MKLRIKFAKYGCMKFIGHLDIMRFFQKAIRRAEIDIAYSEGFSPHQIMSFAAPLGVGQESEGEYLDIQVHSAAASRQIAGRLNQMMTEGLKILSVRRLPEGSKNAMSIVAAADYQIRFYEECPQGFLQFMEQKKILIVKKTKKNETEMDIRPLIFDARTDKAGIFLKLAAGSVDNLKPELVAASFFSWLGKEWDPFSCQIRRLELYARLADSFIPLEELGEIIDSIE